MYVSIPQMVMATAERYPYRPAFWLRKGAEREQLSYRDLIARMLNISAGLRELGVGQGTRVAIYADNSPEWSLACLTTLAAGGVVVPLDRQLKYFELRSIITHASIEHLFINEELRERLSDLAAMTAPHPQLISLDVDIDDLLTLARLERLGESSTFEAQVPSERETSILIFTSGTSGDSKGVMLSQRNILANLESVLPHLPLYPEDRCLSVLPLHHTFETTAGFLYPLSRGASIAHVSALNSTAIAKDIKEFEITLICGVPLLFEKMYLRIRKRLAEAPATKRAYVGFCRAVGKLSRALGAKLLTPLRKQGGLDSLRVLVSGGAALAPEINNFFNELGITLVQGYGLTEASPVISVSPLSDNVPESVGLPLPGIDVRIVEPNAEGIGEVAVRGDNVMLGYFENKEATDAVLREGWLYTGDLGCLDRRGYLHITGRRKNVIVTPAGKNIYPEEIEALLDNSPYILESAVLPRKRGSGEEPVAIVVPDLEIISANLGEKSTAEVEELVRHEAATISAQLADYKRLKDLLVSAEELPKTSTRKVKKYLLLDELRKKGVL